ncbi:hypothetical protein J6590_101900 [Homalodisca vitripennis]|nr:hypothetical protein J6590_101900 [Homalodisca vitripennis]
MPKVKVRKVLRALTTIQTMLLTESNQGNQAQTMNALSHARPRPTNHTLTKPLMSSQAQLKPSITSQKHSDDFEIPDPDPDFPLDLGPNILDDTRWTAVNESDPGFNNKFRFFEEPGPNHCPPHDA